MSETLIQMAALISCGAFWRIFKPLGLAVEQVRLVLTTVVYYLLLPALVLQVLWQAHIGWHSFNYTVLGMASIGFGVIGIWICGRIWHWSNAQIGSIMLAASFSNVTNLGLPVLEQTFGVWARSVAIQMDLFATAPLLFTLGILIARHYGEWDKEQEKKGLALLNTPPFWAAAVAVVLNIARVPLPEIFDGILQRLSGGVIPLMLFSLGLALNWQSLHIRKLKLVVPVIVIKLILMPGFAILLTGVLVFDDAHRAAAVLEMAMPSMVLGIVFCDRYQLDASLYAASVTLTTILSMVTLPFWYSVMT